MPHFESLGTKSTDPLERFSSEDRQVIKEKLHILSSLVYLIGKDYGMEVEINPEEGWHWDFENNVVRADPQDLLTKPIEFLRFVMSHEAGHRRISRGFEVIPREVWSQPGFGFMMNAIEDPRDNNFVADIIPNFREEMKYAYGPESETAQFETSMREKAQGKFGTQPRFMQAGFEYIRLWYQISLGVEPVVREDLPEDVRKVVIKTLPAARRSWNTYPSPKEAEEGTVVRGKSLTGEETITEYARASFNINHKIIWPLFKTLIDKDIEDQKNKQSETEKNNEDDAMPEGGGENSLSDEGSKPETEVSPSQEEIEEMIKEFAEELAKHFQGESEKAKEKESNEAVGEVSPEVTEDVEDQEVAEELKVSTSESKNEVDTDVSVEQKPLPVMADSIIQKLVKALEARNAKETLYQEVLRELGPLIDQLTFELQEIFNKRKHTRWEAGYKSGKKVHVGRAIQEEVRKASPFETGAFMRREQPQEADYAIELLVDLSGSMDEDDSCKILEAYRAVVVLSEVLNNIGIKFAVTGFNSKLHDFKIYGEDLGDTVRQGYEKMLFEVTSFRAQYNDDGWALDTVHDRVLRQEEKQKIIFVISDGQPAPSFAHRSYDLRAVISKVLKSKVKLIGLGLGSETGHVQQYYPNSVANISVEDLSKVLTQKVREVIEQG